MAGKAIGKTLRIVVSPRTYKAFLRACREDELSQSSFGRRLIIRALRARLRDKNLQPAPEDPNTEDEGEAEPWP